jgi:hypothetical protein
MIWSRSFSFYSISGSFESRKSENESKISSSVGNSWSSSQMA